MTPAERVFWNRAHHRAAALAPELRDALLRAFELIRESIPQAELARIIASGNVEAVVRVAMNEAITDIAFRRVRDRIRRGVESNVGYFAQDLPKGGKVNGHLAVGFDILNPKTIEGIRTLDTKVLETLQTSARDVVKTVVETGLRNGANPRVIARDLVGSIGLAPNQEAAVRNFRTMLETGDREALTRALRDRRFDRTLDRALGTAGEGLTAEQVDVGLLEKTWRGVKDARERPEHLAMEGQTVPFDQPFSNGQMIPGETEFNCRCISIIHQRRP